MPRLSAADKCKHVYLDFMLFNEKIVFTAETTHHALPVDLNWKTNGMIAIMVTNADTCRQIWFVGIFLLVSWTKLFEVMDTLSGSVTMISWTITSKWSKHIESVTAFVFILICFILLVLNAYFNVRFWSSWFIFTSLKSIFLSTKTCWCSWGFQRKKLTILLLSDWTFILDLATYIKQFGRFLFCCCSC